MKAAILHGVRDVRFERVEKPVLQAGEALLRVRACGICGSDLHTYREGLFPDLGAVAGQGRILGHEFSGEIEQINGVIEGLAVGDRITTAAIGANAEYLKITKKMTQFLVPVPKHVSHAEAATTEPLATALHAAKLAVVEDDESIVIMGAGIIGLGILQCIRADSQAHITVVDLSDKRLALAQELGANVTINARNEDVLGQIMPNGQPPEDLLQSQQGGVDTVFDCVGATAGFKGTTVLEQALAMVKHNGKVVVVAVFERAIEIDPNIIVRKGVRLIGSWAWDPEEFIAAFDLISTGSIDRTPLISHEFTLEDAADAYATQDSADTAIKVMLVP